MSAHTSSPLEVLLRKCCLDWMIEWFAPPERAISFWCERLAKARQEEQRRFGANTLPLTEEALAEQYEANPHKVEAFLQALATTANPAMLVMVARILQGADIVSVELSYKSLESFRIRIGLREPDDLEEEPPGAGEVYESDDVCDAALLRHFSISKLDAKPLFNNFFPLYLGRSRDTDD